MTVGTKERPLLADAVSQSRLGLDLSSLICYPTDRLRIFQV
jgi:hypothetical protein